MIDAAVSLLVFADDWGRHPSSCQHLVRRLLASHRVWWVNTIGMRPPRFDVATLSRGCEKVCQWLGRRRGDEATTKNPTVINPRMWPWVRRPHDRWINRRLLTRSLAQVVDSMPGRRIAVTTIPIVADLVGRLAVDRWAYYCVDDFAAWPGLDHEPIDRLERKLIEKADVLIATSETLETRLKRGRSEVHLLTHGVDLTFWRSHEHARQARLSERPRPRIVFWGVIDQRLDVGMLRRLASDLTAGEITLIGPTQDPDRALYSIPRVTHAPAVPLEVLPSVAAQADVLIMPYRDDLPVTQAMEPLKLKEYLATGKAVVVSDLPATRPWIDCLDVADSAEEFSAMVRARALSGPAPDQLRERRRLESESWSAKAEEFQRLLVS
jgi:glycosyltransferase involved in cell wall biosynthesis